ncbi:MAG TPA: regulatory protein RecX [Bacteroidales bacterium]|nr:regulatory protein RecX [Bacteroidales bacterium]
MNNYSEALSAAAGYCSLSEHCTSEVIEKVKRFDLTPDDLEKLIKRLKDEGYLNENRYVKAFVKDKFRFSKWGRIKIRYALRQKGISSTLADEGLAEISDDDYREMLISLLRIKKPSIKANSPYELRGKLLRFAAGRGFELDLTGSCLKEMGMDDEE